MVPLVRQYPVVPDGAEDVGGKGGARGGGPCGRGAGTSPVRVERGRPDRRKRGVPGSRLKGLKFPHLFAVIGVREIQGPPFPGKISFFTEVKGRVERTSQQQAFQRPDPGSRAGGGAAA